MTSERWRRAAGLYRTLSRLLPREAERFQDDAAGDLVFILEEAWRTKGWSGWSTAYVRALFDLGARVVTERVRQVVGGIRGVGGKLRGVASAGRVLKRQPFYSAVVTLTLVLGITGASTVFAAVDAILLRPLDYPEPDRIVDLRHHAPGLDLPNIGNSPGMVHFYRENAPFLEHQAYVDENAMNLSTVEETVRVLVTEVSPSIFDILQVSPAQGRRFNSDDERAGRPPVAIVSHSGWINQLGGDPAVVGSTVRLDGVLHQVVGIMPEGFHFPDAGTFALVAHEYDPQGDFGEFGHLFMARLRTGITLDQARAELDALQPRVVEFFDLGDDFIANAQWATSLETLLSRQVDGVRRSLLIVMGTVIILLMIAGANVTNLLLARAEVRHQEITVRRALGSGRGQIRALWFGETFLLCGIACALSLLLVPVANGALVSSAPVPLPRLEDAALTWRVAGFTVLLATAAAVILGIVPVLRSRSSRGYPGTFGVRGSTGSRAHQRTRSLLVGTQLAMALILMTGSGLLLRSVQKMRSADPGFDPTNVATFTLRRGGSTGGIEAADYFRRVAEGVSALPGVRSVGLGSLIPLGAGSATGGSFYIESQPRDDDDIPTVAMYSTIGADYLATLNVDLVRGRALDPSDWRGGAPVMLINETFADRFLGGDGIGEGIKWDEPNEFATVVGVVADTHSRDLEGEPEPWAYLPMVVGEWGYPNLVTMSLFVKMETGIEVPSGAIRELIRGIDSSVPIVAQSSMEEVLLREVAPTRFTMTLLGISALTALLLGGVGLFGATAYVVGRRTREIGIRMALGARPATVRAMVVRQGVAVSLLGAAVGIVGSIALSSFMANLLFEISPLDPITYVAVTVSLLTVAFFATYLPALRASSIHPTEALTYE